MHSSIPSWKSRRFECQKYRRLWQMLPMYHINLLVPTYRFAQPYTQMISLLLFLCLLVILMCTHLSIIVYFRHVFNASPKQLWPYTWSTICVHFLSDAILHSNAGIFDFDLMNARQCKRLTRWILVKSLTLLREWYVCQQCWNVQQFWSFNALKIFNISINKHLIARVPIAYHIEANHCSFYNHVNSYLCL